MSQTLNAVGTLDSRRVLTIKHFNCGTTQTVEPFEVDEDGVAYFGSDADFCLTCEAAGFPAGLNFFPPAVKA